MPTDTAPTSKPATFRTRLLAAQNAALETLLHLAQDLTNPSQARLASTALLRTKLPDAGDDEEEPRPEDRAAIGDSAPPPTAPPPPPDRSRKRANHDRRAPHTPADDHDSPDSLTALAAALDRITRAPGGIVAKLLASGAPFGESAPQPLLSG